MKLVDWQIVFITIGLIGILLFAAPTITMVLKSPAGQPFSELYILGPNHSFENFPTDITKGETYTLHIGVTNYLGHSSDYTIYIKMATNQSLPDIDKKSPSTQSPLYEYKFFLKNEAKWEAPLAIKIETTNTPGTIGNVNFNGVSYSLNVETQSDDTYYLIIELWILNPTTRILEYNERFVSLKLNIS